MYLRRRQLGAFGVVRYQRVYRDPGENWGGKQAFIEINLPFVFGRDAVHADKPLRDGRFDPASPMNKTTPLDPASFGVGMSPHGMP